MDGGVGMVRVEYRRSIRQRTKALVACYLVAHCAVDDVDVDRSQERGYRKLPVVEVVGHQD